MLGPLTVHLLVLAAAVPGTARSLEFPSAENVLRALDESAKSRKAAVLPDGRKVMDVLKQDPAQAVEVIRKGIPDTALDAPARIPGFLEVIRVLGKLDQKSAKELLVHWYELLQKRNIPGVHRDYYGLADVEILSALGRYRNSRLVALLLRDLQDMDSGQRIAVERYLVCAYWGDAMVLNEIQGQYERLPLPSDLSIYRRLLEFDLKGLLTLLRKPTNPCSD